MAIQDAKNFLDALKQNPELHAQVTGSFDQVIKAAQQNGYNVSKKDLADELSKRWGMTTPPSYGEDPDTCFL
jgi:predicted ribosomally synthesized peptide with nif11-like leader